MTGFLPRLAAHSAPAPGLAGDVGGAASAFVSLRAPDAPPSLPLAVAELESAETFSAVSTEAGDLIASGRAAKFLIDRRRPHEPTARFVNGNFVRDGVVPEEAQFHYPFGRATFAIPEPLDEFNEVTYFTTTSGTSPAPSARTTSTDRPSRSTACSSTRRT